MVNHFVSQSNNVIKRAKMLAQSDLEQCFSPEGVIAGTHHFVDLWARDSLFATLGLFGKKNADMVKKTIVTFLKFQRDDGLIPYRVMRSHSSVGKYFGKPSYLKSPRPNYRSHQSGGTVPDGGLLVVIAAAEHYRRTKDLAFLNDVYPKLARSIEWFGAQFDNGPVREWFQCEWADGVLKIGTVLYTNILYVKALEDMSYIARVITNPQAESKFIEQKSRIHELFMKTFWNGRFLSDWVDYKRHDFFASHANFLAIIFGVVDYKKANSILDIAPKVSHGGFTIETNYPAYPLWRVPLIQIAVGMRDYHNRGCLWLQPGITYAIALYKTGKKKLAFEWLERVAHQIVAHEGVFEVYEKNGMPVNRLLYHSEGPFSWSAGLFIYACDVMAKEFSTRTIRQIRSKYLR